MTASTSSMATRGSTEERPNIAERFILEVLRKRGALEEVYSTYIPLTRKKKSCLEQKKRAKIRCTNPRPRHFIIMPVAPVAYQVSLEPGIGQFREFEPPRAHARIISWRLFLVHKIDLRTARERELATFDEKSTSSGIAEPYAR